MNSYNWISVKQIIGSVIRRVGLKDTSLIPDLAEWTAECLQILQLTLTLDHFFEKDLHVVFHKTKKPCGTREIYAIEYCGMRLRTNNTVRDPRAPRDFPQQTFDAEFMSTVTRENTPNGNFLWSSEADKIQQLPWNTHHWYKLDDTHILTSFEEGYITVFGGKVPTDKDGYLMIPDEGRYKEALRWFLRACLAARGYVYGKMGESECFARFETWAARGITEITMPSVDQVQADMDTFLRFIPQYDFYDSFFTTPGSSGIQ